MYFPLGLLLNTHIHTYIHTSFFNIVLLKKHYGWYAKQCIKARKTKGEICDHSSAQPAVANGLNFQSKKQSITNIMKHVFTESQTN